MIQSISKPSTKSKLSVSNVANKENEVKETETAKMIKSSSETEQKL